MGWTWEDGYEAGKAFTEAALVRMPGKPVELSLDLGESDEITRLSYLRGFAFGCKVVTERARA